MTHSSYLFYFVSWGQILKSSVRLSLASDLYYCLYNIFLIVSLVKIFWSNAFVMVTVRVGLGSITVVCISVLILSKCVNWGWLVFY